MRIYRFCGRWRWWVANSRTDSLLFWPSKSYNFVVRSLKTKRVGNCREGGRGKKPCRLVLKIPRSGLTRSSCTEMYVAVPVGMWHVPRTNFPSFVRRMLIWDCGCSCVVFVLCLVTCVSVPLLFCPGSCTYCHKSRSFQYYMYFTFHLEQCTWPHWMFLSGLAATRDVLRLYFMTMIVNLVLRIHNLQCTIRIVAPPQKRAFCNQTNKKIKRAFCEWRVNQSCVRHTAMPSLHWLAWSVCSASPFPTQNSWKEGTKYRQDSPVRSIIPHTFNIRIKTWIST